MITFLILLMLYHNIYYLRFLIITEYIVITILLFLIYLIFSVCEFVNYKHSQFKEKKLKKIYTTRILGSILPFLK